MWRQQHRCIRLLHHEHITWLDSSARLQLHPAHQWYSSSQNHFSFSFYIVWDQSIQHKFLYSIWILFSSSFYKVFLEIISVQFKFLHHFSNSFCHRQYSNIGVRFREGVSPSQWGSGLMRGLSEIFLPRNGAFCVHSEWHIIRQFKKFRQRQTNNSSISF